MNRLIVVTAVFSIGLIAACSPEPEPKSIQFYIDNPTERTAMLARCKTDGSKAIETDCARAMSAAIGAAEEKGIGSVDFGKKPR